MKFAPVFASVHGVIAAATIGIVLLDPVQNGMAPIPLIVMDVPVSMILAELLGFVVKTGIIRPQGNVYLYVLSIAGTGWWYFLGHLIDRRLEKRRAGLQERG